MLVSQDDFIECLSYGRILSSLVVICRSESVSEALLKVGDYLVLHDFLLLLRIVLPCFPLQCIERIIETHIVVICELVVASGSWLAAWPRFAHDFIDLGEHHVAWEFLF